MVLIIIGAVLLVVAVVLISSRRKNLGEALDIKYYETSKVADVVGIYKQLSADLGAGNYSGNIVELSGTGYADSPLTAEFSKKPALFCETILTREYEVKERKKDRDGNYHTENVRKKETLSRNSEYIPFYLEDDSGEKIRVDMNGAKKDLHKSWDRFEREPPPNHRSFQDTGDSKTLGFRYQEKIIPANVRLYVLGEVSDRQGELTVLKPLDREKQFRVSVKTEEEIIKSVEGSAKTKLVIAVILGVIGLGLIIGGIL